MSKAFTREEDEEREERVFPRRNSELPTGSQNWMTADGVSRLGQELETLRQRRAETMGGVVWVREIEQRIADLEYALSTAVVVEDQDYPTQQVHFGATVTVREENGDGIAYRIVGVDEADFERRWISWVSPLARALMNKKIGQRVVLQSPAGERTIEIVAITDKIAEA